MKLFRHVFLISLLVFPLFAFAQSNVVNVYAWTGEIPDNVIKEFEHESGIKVNFSTYESNEIMFAKLRATAHAGYDIVMPSSYFVDRMRRLNMLETLDKSKLSNWKNLNPAFLHPIYDPQTETSVPFIWGITGIFVNKNAYQPNSIKKWTDLWDPRFVNQLMLLDDSREVFSMALLSLVYSANDTNPDHIKQAYLKLKALMQNVKVFSTDTVVSILIDEDANAGMAWNGDAFKASQENPNIQFIFPQDGFVIWVDNFSIPKDAPHKDAAYAFINFILRPDIAKEVALGTSFPITNLAGEKLLPPEIRNNATIYPSQEVLKHGQFQIDLGEETLDIYEKYWEQLKMGG